MNLESLYISPGLIDFNIHRYEQWEDQSELTRAAVSGGVTLCVETRDSNSAIDLEPVPLYCDLGALKVVNQGEEPDFEEMGNVLGVKGYLTAPRHYIPPIRDLKQWLWEVEYLDLPIILDATYVDAKALYYSSPFRHLPLEERVSGREYTAAAVLAGGFLADSSSSGSSPEDVSELPRQQYHRNMQSKIPLDRVRADDREFDRQQSWGEDRSPINCIVREKPRTKTYHVNTEGPEKSDSFHNIFSALHEKIEESAENRESLFKAEIMAYRGEGQTKFRFKSSKSEMLPELEPLEKAQQKQKCKRRPRPLALSAPKTQIPPESTYLFHLAQYPDTMETKGVDKVLAALETHPCPIHLANLSSATAVSRVRLAREKGVDITCETCPHFLFFTDQAIRGGDTRFKNFPPIRNASNCNFLWELLTMNKIEAVCSQHIPVSEQFKCKPSFPKSVSGINGLGFTLQVLWTLLKKPFTDIRRFEHYLIRLSKWTSANPAKILKLKKRGSIAPGMYADLVIWDPFATQTIRNTYSRQASQCPYLQTQLSGHIVRVYVRGQTAYCESSFSSVGKVVTRVHESNSSLTPHRAE